MICKNLLTLATFLFTASAIQLTLKEDDPCMIECPPCQEDPCPPCADPCEGQAPPASMESPANITVHLIKRGDQTVDETLFINRIVNRPTPELPPNTILLPGDELLDLDLHVAEKNGEPQDIILTVDHQRNLTATGMPLTADGEGAVDLEILVVKAFNVTSGEELPGSDIWLKLDRFINGTVDNGTNSTNITGGFCNNVHVSSWSSTYDGQTSTGSYDQCMDDCVNEGGTVVTVVDDQWEDYSSSYPECQITEEICGADWWQTMGTEGWCDLGCKISGGKLQEGEYGRMCEYEEGACAFPYNADWTDEEQCDSYCATNSGVLIAETGMCLYDNMT